MVQLQTSDGQVHSVDKRIAEKSVVIKNMLEDIGESQEHAIPLPNVSSEIFNKVLEWCEHHKDDEPTVAEEDDQAKPLNSEDISEWDREFCKVDNDTLFKIILAANYLDIKPLLDLGCKTVANMLKGKTPQQIRDLFGLENDFTPEEEEQIRKEMAWAMDS